MARAPASSEGGRLAMVTIHEVARQAGVSPATVSRVFNHSPHVSAEATLRGLKTAQRLRYRPTRGARSLKTRRTQVLGLVISNLSNVFFGEIVSAIHATVEPQGYSCMVMNTDENLAKERAAIDVLLAHRVDGLIVAAAGGESSHLQELVRDGVPLVLLDRRVPGVPADAVVVDNEAGAYRAVHHLIALGHRRIGLIVGLQKLATGQERYAGYLRALQEAGIEPDPALIHRGEPFREVGYAEARALLTLPDPPTAIFTANNFVTTGCLVALRQAGVRIPEEMAIVGFDDMDWSTIVQPALTVVAQPTERIGTVAAQLLLERLESGGREPPRVVTLPTRLIVRASCGARLGARPAG